MLGVRLEEAPCLFSAGTPLTHDDRVLPGPIGLLGIHARPGKQLSRAHLASASLRCEAHLVGSLARNDGLHLRPYAGCGLLESACTKHTHCRVRYTDQALHLALPVP